MLIYLPTYKYVLDNVPRVQHILKRIKERSIDHDLVFLDYNTNTDVTRDISQPLSHAGLVKLYIEDRYPEYDPSIRPMTKEEVEDKRQRQKEEKKARTTLQNIKEIHRQIIVREMILLAVLRTKMTFKRNFSHLLSLNQNRDYLPLSI